MTFLDNRDPRRSARRVFWILAVISTAACGGDGTGPVDSADPGFLRVSVTGPLNPQAAFKFRITGGAVDSVRSTSGQLYFETLGPALHRAIVIAAADRSHLLEFWLPDRNVLDSYGVNLEEVAATGTYQNLPVSAYVMTMGR